MQRGIPGAYRGLPAAVSDTRWFEIEADIAAAVRHFGRAAAIVATRPQEEESLASYKTEMAFMHAMQAGHTSFEKALLRILDMLAEDRPVGDQWHADLIARVAAAMPHRPAILPGDVVGAAHETRKFRHRVVHAYDDFDWLRARGAITAAAQLSELLPETMRAFRQAIDPDRD
jgi:hypothetical protein